MKETFIIAFIFFASYQLHGQPETRVNGQIEIQTLSKVLDKINTIKTATYYSEKSSSAPYDTTYFNTYKRFMKMYLNPEDSFSGASFSSSFIGDTLKYDLCYDGKYDIRFDWENRSVQIDTLEGDDNGRPYAPFLIRVRTLIEYALNNADSTQVTYETFPDSVKINFSFNNKMVEISDVTPSVRYDSGKVSEYRIVINAKNYLPFKLIRMMPHQRSKEVCTYISYADELDYEFDALQQIPPDFTTNGEEKVKMNPGELVGQRAPDWLLEEVNGESVSLKNLTDKVLLIQFTGVGCGPCHASLPLLKELAEENKDKSFEILSIETWSTNRAGLQRYKEKNDFNWKFLIGDKALAQKYQVHGVPVFFVLNEKGVIEKAFLGYSKDKTEKELKEILRKLI